jgi:hypothetical protein
LHLINLIRAFCFFVKASFDVYREDKRRYCWGVVEDVDFSEQAKRIYFRFKKSKDNHVEWIDFGSPRICTFKSKTKKKPKIQKKEHDGAALLATAIKILNGNTDVESTGALNANDNHNNINPVKPPPTNDTYRDREIDPLGNGIPSNMLQVGGSSHMSRSYDPYANDTNSMAHLSSSAHRLPDFITPPDVSSFTVVNHRLPVHQEPQQQQHELDNSSNRMQYGSEASKTSITELVAPPQSSVPEVPISTLYRSGGSIPSGWSALDILAAVTIDAAPTTITSTTSMNPALSTFAVSSNSTSSTAGPVQASYGWGGDSSNGNNHHNNLHQNNQNHGNNYSNGNHHEPPWPNQQQYMPMWPQQQPHLEQQWYPSLDSIRMSQQQQQRIPTVAVNNNYDVLSQQQKWHNTAAVFNGDSRSNNSSNSNNMDDRKHPAANQYFTRYE